MKTHKNGRSDHSMIVVEAAPLDEQVIRIGGTGQDIVVISGHAGVRDLAAGSRRNGWNGDCVVQMEVGPSWSTVTSCDSVVTVIDAANEVIDCDWRQEEVERGRNRIRLSARIKGAARPVVPLTYHLLAYGQLSGDWVS